MRHMIRSHRVTFPCILAALVMAACGDEPAGLEGDALTQAEIQAVLSAFSGTFSSVSSGSAASSSAYGAPAATEVNQSFDLSVSCPQGGTITASGSLSGSVDQETLASDLRYELALSPAACVVTTETTALTVDGSPDVTVVIDYLFNETTFSMDGTEQGWIRYTADDGRSGACSIDISFSTAVDQTSNDVQQSVTGIVCGVSASAFQVLTAG